MTIWHAELVDEHFNNINNGSKTVELRPERSKWLDMRVDHFIKFSTVIDGAELVTRIVRIDVYSGFAEAIAAVGFKRLMPNTQSADECLEAYKAIGDYAKWTGRVLVFTIEKIRLD